MLIAFSRPRCFLFANNSDFSPENALDTSSFEPCNTIMITRNTDTTNNK